MLNLRALLTTGLAVAAVGFLVLGGIANFRNTKGGWVTLKTVLKSTGLFMLAAVSLAAALTAYDTSLWTGSAVLLLVAAGAALVRVLIAVLSNRFIVRRRPKSRTDGAGGSGVSEGHIR